GDPGGDLDGCAHPERGARRPEQAPVRPPERGRALPAAEQPPPDRRGAGADPVEESLTMNEPLTFGDLSLLLAEPRAWAILPHTFAIITAAAAGDLPFDAAVARGTSRSAEREPVPTVPVDGDD